MKRQFYRIALLLLLFTTVVRADDGHSGEENGTRSSPPVNDTRFHKHLLKIAKEYRSYGRVDADARMALLDCRAPSIFLGLPRLNRSDDEQTHGRKIYYLYARRTSAYRNVAKDRQQKQQAIVKETWDAKTVTDKATRASGNQVRVGKQILHAARSGKQLYLPGKPGSLFVMYRNEAQDLKSATDEGWVYATISRDRKTVTSAGRVRSCMQCHQSAPFGRLHGIKDLSSRLLKSVPKKSGSK